MNLTRTVRLHRTGGPDLLVVDTVNMPAPGTEAQRIRLRALGLDRAEAPIRAGVPAPASAWAADLLPYGVPARMLAQPPILRVQAPHLASDLPRARTVVPR